MNQIRKLQAYGDTHHPKWLDLIRIVMGAILVVKGYYYISNIGDLNQLLLDNDFHLYNYVVIHYVAFAHLIGGICIMLGLITRVAVLAQIPILLGAIIFVHAKHGLLSAESGIFLPLLLLLLLIFYFIYGSGPWSMDAYMENHRSEWDTNSETL